MINARHGVASWPDYEESKPKASVREHAISAQEIAFVRNKGAIIATPPNT